jgi:predicted dehydrogenase
MALRIGVIGVGALGIHHTRCASVAPGAELIGVFEHHEERGRRALEFGAKLFPSRQALLGEVDAVVVSTPTKSHFEVASAAIDRGVACLVEKPLAATTEEAEELVRRAEAAGVPLFVGHVERMGPMMLAAGSEIQRPRFIEAHRLAPFGPRGLDVDVLLDLMIHDIDLVLHWTGAEPTSVAAAGLAVLSSHVDIANARLEWADGCVANLTASRVSLERMRKARIFQEDAYLSIDFLHKTGEILRADGPAIRAALDAADGSSWNAQAVLPRLLGYVQRKKIEPGDAEPLAVQMEGFVRAVLGEDPGSLPRPATGREGLAAVRVASRVRDSVLERVEQWTRA